MSVVDFTRRRAELERMGARRASQGLVDETPTCRRAVDMRHARRFAEAAEARRPRVLEDRFWADRHSPEPRG